MTVGLVGLGKMGASINERLKQAGFSVKSFDPYLESTASSLEELIEQLPEKKIIWLMVPQAIVGNVITELKPHLSSGDILIDGGNSQYDLSVARSKELGEAGIAFVDAGVSGGPGGAKEGACIMVGGEVSAVAEVSSLFKALAQDNGWRHVGKSGAGHFVKMVHNGIEYGIMQSIAEGFNLMNESEFDINLHDVADLYQHGSIIESALMGDLKTGFARFGTDLNGISGEVAQNGEGRWTVDYADKINLPIPAIKAAVEFRDQSKGNPSFLGQIVMVIRHIFGGHSKD